MWNFTYFDTHSVGIKVYEIAYLIFFEDFEFKPILKLPAEVSDAFSFYEVFCEQHHPKSVP